MNCSELRDHFELYSLGLAEEPERSEIRAHLDRGCEVCMKEVKHARELAAILASTAAPLMPSPKLRRRILAAAGVESYGFGWTPALAAVAALSLCAAVYFSGREPWPRSTPGSGRRRQGPRFRQPIAGCSADRFQPAHGPRRQSL